MRTCLYGINLQTSLKKKVERGDCSRYLVLIDTAAFTVPHSFLLTLFRRNDS